MSKPITLFRPRRLVTSDDGGTTIVKYSLPQPVSAPYDASQLDGTQRTSLVYIPSLQSICLKKLSEYPNQLHVLEATRIQYKPPEDDRDHDLLREVIPTDCHENAEQLSEEFLKTVDPRLWATLIQIYTDLPDSLRTYQLPLSDAHMPVLQDIPSTRHFSLITILELRSCPELNDSTVVELGQLHGLTALDLGATALTSHGLKALAKTLVKNSAHSRVLSGPWGLRMLSLRNCMKISDDALENLARFPLLSAVDLRGTCCTPTAYRKTLFSPSADETLYHPTPLRDALSALANKSSTTYSHPEPFFIHINKLAHQATMPPPIRRPGPGPRSALGRLTVTDVFGSAATTRPSRVPPDVVTLVDRALFPPSRPGFRHNMDLIASLETQRLASEQAAAAFYSAFSDTRTRLGPNSRPVVFNHRHTTPSRPKASGSLRVSSSTNQPPDSLRLYRDPPPWSTLDDIQTSTLEEAFSKPVSRPRTDSDNRPQSSQTLVESNAARQSVRAVFGLLEKRIGSSAHSSGGGQPSHSKATRVNPFSREMVRSVFATSDATAEPETSPANAKHVHKRRRVSMEAGVAESEAADRPTPKSTLAVPPRSTKPLKPIFSLPRPLFPEQEAARKQTALPQTPAPARPSPTAVQAKLSSFASEAVPALRPPGSGFHPDKPRKTLTTKAPGDSGRPQQQPLVASGGKKKRKSTDSSSSFDWKSWGR